MLYKTFDKGIRYKGSLSGRLNKGHWVELIIYNSRYRSDCPTTTVRQNLRFPFHGGVQTEGELPAPASILIEDVSVVGG